MAKLMRYEARSDLRLLLPVYAACLTLGVLSCLLRLLPDAGGDTLRQLAMAAVYTLLLGAAVTAQIAALAAGPAVSLIRFYRTLGTRGHFFFSLPLLPSQMLGAHLALALAWTAAGALLVYALSLLGMPLFAGLNGDLYSGQRPLPDLFALLALMLLFAAMLYLCFCLAAAVSTRLGHIRLPMTAALLFCFALAAGAAFLFLMAAVGRFGVSALPSGGAPGLPFCTMLGHCAVPLLLVDAGLWGLCCRQLGPRLELA